MKKLLLAVVTLTTIGVHAFIAKAYAEIQPDNLFPRVVMVTNMGEITVELDRSRAPRTVANFLRYVEKASYNNTIFHRLVPGFVLQGGGYDKDFQEKPNFGEIVNESGNGLKNQYGTIAMARDNAPHSATRQFFFNLNDNSSLNPSDSRWGYAVFGRVVAGEAVLEKLAAQESQPYDDTTGWADVPTETLLLERVKVVPEAQ
ncbi:peptidylprolyl isomerase [Idiomarina xiamenensis]|uniref:Peptidyl-prolyl cis-trans isomerase n=1 Tax=Idiomarina xiamenensis 10-D-4 TaxID=740709 RepID=K2JHL4_9GAMM|nr:peptidylprolyl isomerase [Idiomarina xiamenensis]EKE82861.1 peptidyl-prolyl cis-trans isomerase [Idiomarina xiamenensis 10-D-4]